MSDSDDILAALDFETAPLRPVDTIANCPVADCPVDDPKIQAQLILHSIHELDDVILILERLAAHGLRDQVQRNYDLYRAWVDDTLAFVRERAEAGGVELT